MSYTFVTHHEDLDERQWHAFVSAHPRGTIFQTPEMFHIYLKTKNYKPVLIACIDQDTGEMVAMLVAVIQKDFSGIFGFLSARSIVWGGPLVKDENPEIYNLILKKYNETNEEKVMYTQFRLLEDASFVRLIFEKNGYIYEPHLNILVNLVQAPEDLWKQVHSKRRNEIRKAMKEKLIVRKLSSKDEISEAYNILKHVYQRAKLPFPDLSLFHNVFTELSSKGFFRAYGAYDGDVLTGTMFTLTFRDRIYDWYAGSDEQFFRKHPNDIIPWAVFLDAREAGFTLFDFGGAGKPGISYGVRDYKVKFGGKTFEFGRFEKIHNRFLFRIARLGFHFYFKIFN